MRPVGFHHTEGTKRKMRLNHGRWNKGLTKELDERVKNQSNALSAHWQVTPHPRGMLGKQHSAQTKQLMSQNRKGFQNSNWKDGITEGVRLFRKSRRYQQWRQEVLEKAQHQCAACPEKAAIAHHIKTIKAHPELRFDVENGMALCSRCHGGIHRKESGND